MDEIDYLILNELTATRPPSLREIGNRVNRSRTAILNRTRRMAQTVPPLLTIESGARGLSLTPAGRIIIQQVQE